MTVPSYDDLTPGIPDVVDAESVSQLALFLREDLKRNPPSQGPATQPSAPSTASLPSTPSIERHATALFACLRAASSAEKLAEIARDFSPRIMRVSANEVLLDVSGLGRLIGEPPAIAKELARALDAAGVEAQVAIAPTQTVARLLACARADVEIAKFPNFQISKFPNLPVSLLQPLETLPPAMNHRDRLRPYETFERWGITTLGDLAALPVAELSSRLGRRGVALHRLARGLDPRPFVPDADTPRFIGRLELEWPIEALEPLSFVLARLLEPLSASLERADRGAAAIHLELRLTDRSMHTRVLQLPAPMRDARVLRTLLLLDLESHPPPSPLRGFGETSAVTTAVDIVTIELDPAPARITQFSLLQRALPSPETLSTLTARLSALLGESRIGSPGLIDTHEPGAFQMRRYAPEKCAEGAGRAKGAEGAEGVGAKGADGAALRRQRHPPAIRVSVAHGRPVALAAARRGMPQGAVIQAAGPWRTSGGWWGTGGSHEICPWSRDEWDVALTSGAVCRIFQDRTTERWFLEGIYD